MDKALKTAQYLIENPNRAIELSILMAGIAITISIVASYEKYIQEVIQNEQN